MAEYLLDTTVLLHQFHDAAPVAAWIEQALSRRDTLATTVINVAEVFRGAHPGERPYWERLFELLPVFPVLHPEGVWAGELRYSLSRQGVQVHLPDALVAAVAVSRRFSIVTANARDFERMGLQVIHLDGGAATAAPR